MALTFLAATGELRPPQLHIPDGFLNLPVSAVCWAITVALLALAVRQTRDDLGERQVPLMGVMAAFIFAAQMINFPVDAGTPTWTCRCAGASEGTR